MKVKCAILNWHTLILKSDSFSLIVIARFGTLNSNSCCLLGHGAVTLASLSLDQDNSSFSSVILTFIVNDILTGSGFCWCRLGGGV